VVLRDY